MAFTKARKSIIAILILVLAFVGLRVYGAYQQERDNALKRAAIDEQKAREVADETERLTLQSDCNIRWMEYENAKLEKRIADLRGTTARTPVEPQCTGHAPRMDEISDAAIRQLKIASTGLEASEYARYERDYASTRKYQTRYLLSRIWAFLTGTEPAENQAEMTARIERATALEECLKKASEDSQRKTCETAFGK